MGRSIFVCVRYMQFKHQRALGNCSICGLYAEDVSLFDSMLNYYIVCKCEIWIRFVVHRVAEWRRWMGSVQLVYFQTIGWSPCRASWLFILTSHASNFPWYRDASTTPFHSTTSAPHYPHPSQPTRPSTPPSVNPYFPGPSASPDQGHLTAGSLQLPVALSQWMIPAS